MPRLRSIRIETAPEEVRAELEAVEQHLGMVPNFIRVLANSPASLRGYLAFARQFAQAGDLDPVLRAQVELHVSEYHESDYGRDSYAAVARQNGLSKDQIRDGQLGHSPNKSHRYAMSFCRELMERRGRVDDASIEHLRCNGFTDGHLVELVAVSCLAAFTNILNHVAGTESDFAGAGSPPPF